MGPIGWNVKEESDFLLSTLFVVYIALELDPPYLALAQKMGVVSLRIRLRTLHLGVETMMVESVVKGEDNSRVPEQRLDRRLQTIRRLIHKRLIGHGSMVVTLDQLGLPQKRRSFRLGHRKVFAASPCTCFRCRKPAVFD